MNTIDALKKMVDHYPGGREAMAVRLGKTDEVLRKELSGAATPKLGAVDACTISALCNEVGSPHADAYATAVAANCGGFVALTVRDMVGKQDLRQDVSGLLKEATDVLQSLTVALADDAISDNERKTLEIELSDVIRKSQDILKGVQANNVASKPALRAA